MGGQCTVQVVRDSIDGKYNRQCTKCYTVIEEASQHEITKYNMDAARLVRGLGRKDAESKT